MPTIPPPSIPARFCPESERLLLSGNEHFLQNDFAGAVEAYTQGLTIAPKSGLIYVNRAQAYLRWSSQMASSSSSSSDNRQRKVALKLQAVRDAHRSTDLEPAWATAWIRIAHALNAILAEGLGGEDEEDEDSAHLKRTKILHGIRAALENALFLASQDPRLKSEAEKMLRDVKEEIDMQPGPS